MKIEGCFSLVQMIPLLKATASSLIGQKARIQILSLTRLNVLSKNFICITLNVRTDWPGMYYVFYYTGKLSYGSRVCCRERRLLPLLKLYSSN